MWQESVHKEMGYGVASAHRMILARSGQRIMTPILQGRSDCCALGHVVYWMRSECRKAAKEG